MYANHGIDEGRRLIRVMSWIGRRSRLETTKITLSERFKVMLVFRDAAVYFDKGEISRGTNYVKECSMSDRSALGVCFGRQF